MSSSYWCYRCNRFIRVWVPHNSITCPDCSSGFIELIHSSPPSSSPSPTTTTTTTTSPPHPPRLRRTRPTLHDRSSSSSPFNPVIVLPTPSPSHHGTFHLYYDDGAGSGLRPLPSTVSDFLLSSGFDRLLHQLSHLELNGLQHPPASKSAVDSMPTVQIVDSHIQVDSHCAVCKDPFELGSLAREMPCKHIYHPDCILPWLSLRNSCPVCRHELPSDVPVNSPDSNQNGEMNGNENEEDETVGLTIWRLPGGGFAVGRFSGGRRGGEGELPVVYTEMDGGFNNSGLPTRISWGSRGGISSQRGGFRRALRNLFSCFGGGIHSSLDSPTSSSSNVSDSVGHQRGRSIRFLSSSRRRNRGLDMGNRLQRG